MQEGGVNPLGSSIRAAWLLRPAREIIAAHGGTLAAVGNPAGGAILRFWLPAAVQD